MDSNYYQKNLEKITLDKKPTLDEMYKIIINLNSKYEKLQQDHNNLKQYVIKNKKQGIEKPRDILATLNKDIKDLVCFIDFIKNIEISLEDLDIIFKNQYVEGITDIIVEKIHRSRTKSLLAFIEKPLTLYIYTKTQSKWNTISFEDIDQILKIMNNKILIIFKEWQIETEKKMDTDKFNELYVQNLRAIIGGNLNNFDKNTKIKNSLYKKLKENCTV